MSALELMAAAERARLEEVEAQTIQELLGGHGNDQELQAIQAQIHALQAGHAPHGSAAAAGEPEPEEAQAEYLDWPMPGNLFVLCNRKDKAGKFVHGDDPIARVQAASLRPHCRDCRGEAIQLRGDFAPRTIRDVLQAKDLTHSPLRVRSCFDPGCSGATGRAYVDLRCRGEDSNGMKCKARTVATGDCVVLPQVSAATAGDMDHAMFMELEEGEPMVRFDPCGHTLGLETFVHSVTSALGGGDAKHQIRKSPQTGEFVLCCPVREQGRPCEQSFVHDVHHYKLVGKAAYGRIKDFGFDASGYGAQQQQQQQAAAAAAAPAPAAAADPVEVLTTQIQEVATNAGLVTCPYDGQVFYKDGACTHIDSCPGRNPDGSKHGRICYYCGKKWADCGQNHKEGWIDNPRRCIWFLESGHPLLRGSHNGGACVPQRSSAQFPLPCSRTRIPVQQ